MNTEEGSAPDEQVVVFHLGNESYGLEITAIEEIIRSGNVTRLPNAPHYIEGVTNLRGRLVPIVNLRTRFGMPPAEETGETRVIVASVDSASVGFIVDAVSEVMRIPESSIDPPSALVTLPDDELVRGVGKLDNRLVCLINLRPLVGQI